jgi:hypothetical protein
MLYILSFIKIDPDTQQGDLIKPAFRIRKILLDVHVILGIIKNDTTFRNLIQLVRFSPKIMPCRMTGWYMN